MKSALSREGGGVYGVTVILPEGHQKDMLSFTRTVPTL